MLQVARLSPRQLGDARDLVQHFLLDQRHPDGGFQDRAGQRDIYYTVFGLEGLVALQADLPREGRDGGDGRAGRDRTVAYLTALGAGERLDFVHLACLARAWATLLATSSPPRPPSPPSKGGEGGEDPAVSGPVHGGEAGADPAVSGPVDGGEAGAYLAVSGQVQGREAGAEPEVSRRVQGGEAGADPATSGGASREDGADAGSRRAARGGDGVSSSPSDQEVTTATAAAGLDERTRDAIASRVETFRSADGGYAQTMGAARGSVYAAFLALGAYQDLRRPLPDPERLLASIDGLRARDGGFANHPDAPVGLTTSMAAAVGIHRQLDRPMEGDVGAWLLARAHPQGGFVASPTTPMPDLLSTATALHALTSLHVPLPASVQESCLDFIDTLWTNRGGFYGHWADDHVDCEYTYYGLLALGHLSL